MVRRTSLNSTFVRTLPVLLFTAVSDLELLDLITIVVLIVGRFTVVGVLV